MFRPIEKTLRARWVWILAFLPAVLWCAAAAAQAPTDVVRVEQDWELVVATPDVATNGPQITCVLSPVGNVESVHAALQLNHRTLLRYAPGGRQLQFWEGGVPLSEHTCSNQAVLGAPGETITWTFAMEVQNNVLTAEVINGTSVTWGAFGVGFCHLSTPTALANLNGYSSDVSVRNSGAGFADNRVQSLVLKRVRYRTADGSVYEDVQPKVVH